MERMGTGTGESTSRNETTQRPKHKWKNNIKIDHKERERTLIFRICCMVRLFVCFVLLIS